MTKADRKRFAEAMALMAIAIDREPSAERTEVYWRFLKDLPIQQIERAIQHIIKNKKIPTFPTLGEIRTLIVQEEDERLDLDAHLAWREACRKSFSSDYSIDDETTLGKTIQLAFGSWGNFGKTSEKDDPFDRRHFIHVYKLVAKQEHRELLAGLEIKATIEQEASSGKSMKFKRGPGPQGRKK